MKVLLSTNLGDIQLELYKDKAPITVENFANYIKSGHYNDTIFHRVINGFMIQGGGMTVDMKQKSTNKEIQNEANNGLKNEKYTIAMARTMAPHSATSQFFINVANNDFLDYKSSDANGWGYAVFGKVIQGSDIVDKIKVVKTSKKNGHDDVPIEAITILSTIIVEE
jgi:peptidyl-prolyl cis-trans isomerase B (cyclophilin B)